MSDMLLSIRITGDANGLKAEILNANQAVSSLGTTAAQASQAATQPLRQVEEQGKRVAAAMKEAETATRAAGQATGITANQMRQLTPQLNDIATGLLTGQSPFMILAQQGTQVTQVFGGFGPTLSVLGGFLTATTVGLGALTAGAVLGVVAWQNYSASLAETQNRLRATRDDWQALARASDESARYFSGTAAFRTDESLNAARAIAGAQNFTGGRAAMESLLPLAGDLSKVLGQDLVKSAELVARALDQPGKVAQELAQSGFRGFTSSVVQNVQRLEAQRGAGAAAAEVLNLLSRASAGAAENMSTLDSIAARVFRTFTAQGLRDTLLGRGSLLNPERLVDPPAGVTGTDPKVALEDALRSRLVAGSREARRVSLETETSRLEGQLSGASEQERARLQAGLRTGRAESYGLRDPFDLQLQGLRDQTAISRAAPGAEQTLLGARISAQRQAERDGRTASPGELSQVQDQVQARLLNDAGSYLTALNRQAVGQAAVAEATSRGTRSAAEAAEQYRAEEEALKSAAVGTEAYNVVVSLLVGQYAQLRDAQQAIRDAQAQYDQGQQLEALRTETDLIGASTAERNRELAVLKERQRILREGGDPQSVAGQQRLAGAANLAAASTEVRRLQGGFDELGRIGDAVGDRIGSSLAQGLAEGKRGFLDLSSIGKTVAAELYQAFFKLAIINPLKNAIGLGGGGAPVLGDVIGSIFKGGDKLNYSDNITSSPARTAIYSDPKPVMHGGGIVGLEAAELRHVPSSVFGGAPRYHSGLMPGEFPAILQQGEGVFTPAQMARLGPAGGGDRVFAPTIHFQGDAGSADDRAALVAELRATWLQDMAAAAPGIVKASKASLLTDVRRRGADQVFR